jgi:acetyl esterase/lipase
MTTEIDRAEVKRPRGIGRIDPALRDAAAGLEIVEFRTESLPAERARADRLAADRAADVDTTDVEIKERVVAGPGGGQLGLRLYRGPATSAAPLVVYAHGGGFVTGNLDTDHAHCWPVKAAAWSCRSITGWRPKIPVRQRSTTWKRRFATSSRTARIWTPTATGWW